MARRPTMSRTTSVARGTRSALRIQLLVLIAVCNTAAKSPQLIISYQRDEHPGSLILKLSLMSLHTQAALFV